MPNFLSGVSQELYKLVSRIAEIANAMGTGQRCDVKKDSTAPGEDHSINVMLLRQPTQEPEAEARGASPTT
ncbi:MAG TPA: hypothetical protein VGK96_04240 [Candidatus Sulfotelmatobacter sp.]